MAVERPPELSKRNICQRDLNSRGNTAKFSCIKYSFYYKDFLKLENCLYKVSLKINTVLAVIHGNNANALMKLNIGTGP